jgi:hypothetical protein
MLRAQCKLCLSALLAPQALPNMLPNKLQSLELPKRRHQTHILCGRHSSLSPAIQAELNIALVVRR